MVKATRVVKAAINWWRKETSEPERVERNAQLVLELLRVAPL